MAANSTSKNPLNDDINDGTTVNSYFQKTVCLKDWWLVKADKDFAGKQVAVAGITSGEKQAVRVFSSAPILRRYDVFTLETVDGICVIIQGFINKARTIENGFPSEVCKHFVFGFPPYWEICARKCSERDSTLMGDAQSNLDFEILSPQAAGTEGSNNGMTKNFDKACYEAETREHSDRKNLGLESHSKSGKKETKYNSKDEEAKSAFGLTSSGASERETSLADYSVENRKNPQLSGSHFNNSTGQPLTSSGLEKNFVPLSIKGNAENKNYIGVKCRLKNLQEDYRDSPLSACQLTNERGCNTIVQSLQDRSKLNSSKKLTERIFFSREADLSEELSRYSEGRGTTCSQKKVQIKFKNNQTSSAELKNEKIVSDSVSFSSCDAVGNLRPNLDSRPRRKPILNPQGTGFQDLTDQATSRNPDARSFEDNIEMDHGVCLTDKDAKHDQNHEGAQESGRMQNKADGYIHSPGVNDDKEKRKKKISSGKKGISQSQSLNRRKARRKLPCSSLSESLSPRKSRKLKEKEKSSVMSPESLCLKRSRSGRWLLPSLEFWRNQRVIYDAVCQLYISLSWLNSSMICYFCKFGYFFQDHRIMGIKDLN